MSRRLIKCYPELKDVNISSCDNTSDLLNNHIYFLNLHNKNRINTRVGSNLDYAFIEPILINTKHASTFIFTSLDCLAQPIVNLPLGFVSPFLIKKPKDYYKEYHKNIESVGGLYWRGNINTHETRHKIINYLNLTNTKDYDLDHWKPMSGGFYKYGCSEKEYDGYYNKLKESDLFLVIRGDKPWTNSFFDCLRSNTIPICINTFYGKIKWHKIGFKKEDLFLDFNTNYDDIELIHMKIYELLKDKDKIMHMKNNICRFYEDIILQDKYLLQYGADGIKAGWGNIIRDTIIKIHNNNYTLDDTIL